MALICDCINSLCKPNHSPLQSVFLFGSFFDIFRIL
nr:MAG TPA: classI-CCAase [Caudoviricetes sp.]